MLTDCEQSSLYQRDTIFHRRQGLSAHRDERRYRISATNPAIDNRFPTGYPCQRTGTDQRAMFHNFKAMTGLLGTMLNMVNTLLFELDLIVVVVTLLSTGFVNIVLSKSQTIRPFYPQDATLWVSLYLPSTTCPQFLCPKDKQPRKQSFLTQMLTLVHCLRPF